MPAIGRAEDGNEEKAPHHGVDGAGGDEGQAADEPGSRVDGGIPAASKAAGSSMTNVAAAPLVARWMISS